MDATNRISIEQCSTLYKVETTFVQLLNDHGLIQLTQSEQTFFIDFEELPNLEKYIHLHYELNINMEGLEAISHLLHRVSGMQEEIRRLHNLLRS